MSSFTKTAILAAKRTPIGNFNGCFSTTSATQLGATAIASAIDSCKINQQEINAVYMGCVLSAGLGQAPARQAAIYANLSEHTPCTTINKMCGSGMQSLIFSHDSIVAGSATTIVAGGMENMSQAPYLLAKARSGYRLGHDTVYDHMMIDGLEDAYQKGLPMGHFAEECVKHYNFTREQQDAFAIQSVERAQHAAEQGFFNNEIAAQEIKTRKQSQLISADEGPQSIKIEKIPQLRPVFSEAGTITAANASSISDGAAAIVLCSEQAAKDLEPLAYIVAHHSHAQAPQWFTTAPIKAITGVLDKANWSLDSVDLFEINEAFAVVTMAAEKDLNIPREKINIQGGACVLGHPIGASGCRIVVTLIHALKQHNLKRGVAALCIGGGEATALAIELA
jgi:acetyl-CoA C-acetyltransferase